MKRWTQVVSMLLATCTTAAMADEPLLIPPLPEADLDFSPAEPLFEPLAEEHATWDDDLFENAYPIQRYEEDFFSGPLDDYVKPASAAKAGKCACGKACKCVSGKPASDCKCGADCKCGQAKCACGKNCQCTVGQRAADCACGKKCACAGGKCGKSKVAVSTCACGANCTCGDAKVARLQRELDAAYQHIEYQDQIAKLKAEAELREHGMAMELMEAHTAAAASRAALEQQIAAQHQQHELVAQLVKIAHATAHKSAPSVESHHLQSRIEQLTIENVQLRKMIEELRTHIELAQQPSNAR